VRTDTTYPAGFMDVIDIDKTDEHFRLVRARPLGCGESGWLVWARAIERPRSVGSAGWQGRCSRRRAGGARGSAAACGP